MTSINVWRILSGCRVGATVSSGLYRCERADNGQRNIVSETAIRGRSGSMAVFFELIRCKKEIQDQLSAGSTEHTYGDQVCVMPLSDHSRTLLGVECAQRSEVLILFTLDISSLSERGLVFIEDVLCRSRLEPLHICCTPSTVTQDTGSCDFCSLCRGQPTDPMCSLAITSTLDPASGKE